MTESAWWYVLAGFLIGFILSTLWEWLFFRARRVRSENRRIAELEASLAARAPAGNAPASALPPPAAGAYQGPGVFLEGEQLPPGGAILIAGGAIASAQSSPPGEQPPTPPLHPPAGERYTFVHAMSHPAPPPSRSPVADGKPGPGTPPAAAPALAGAAALGAAAGMAAAQRPAPPDDDPPAPERTAAAPPEGESFAAPPPQAIAAAAVAAAAHGQEPATGRTPAVSVQAGAPPEELADDELVSEEPGDDEPGDDELDDDELSGEDESMLAYGEPPTAEPATPWAYRTVFSPPLEPERSSMAAAQPPPAQPPPAPDTPAPAPGPHNSSGLADRPLAAAPDAAPAPDRGERDVTQEVMSTAESGAQEATEQDAARRAAALAAAAAGGALLFAGKAEDEAEDEAQADAPAEDAAAAEIAPAALQSPEPAAVPGETAAPAPAAPLPLHALLPAASSLRNNGANASPAGPRGVEPQGIQPGLQRVSGELDSLVNSLQGLIATTDPLLTPAPDAAAAHSSEPAHGAPSQGLADLPVTGPYAAENLSRAEISVVRLMQSARQAGRDLRSIFWGR